MFRAVSRFALENVAPAPPPAGCRAAHLTGDPATFSWPFVGQPSSPHYTQDDGSCFMPCRAFLTWAWIMHPVILSEAKDLPRRSNGKTEKDFVFPGRGGTARFLGFGDRRK